MHIMQKLKERKRERDNKRRKYMSWSQWQTMVNATNDLGITHHFAKKALK